MTVVVPYHLDERVDAFDPVLAADRTVTATPPDTSDPWQRLAAIHGAAAAAVQHATDAPPLVVAGDCLACLGVLAGLQRRGTDAGIVWFDAHPDFHTEQTSTSGYLAGMPLALAAGLGTRTLPDALGLRPVPPARITLVDGRDADPGERVLLGQEGIAAIPTEAVEAAALPGGPLYVHLDIDVLEPPEAGDVRYPVPGGPSLDALVAAVERIAATGRVAAVTIAAVWKPGAPARPEVVRRLAAAGL